MTAQENKYNESRAQLRRLGIPLPQKESEFKSLCIEIGPKRPRVFVEIGSRDGGSLWMLAQFCAPGATVVSIDLENALWGRPKTYKNRGRVLQDLEAKGYDTHAINLDSQLQSTKDELLRLLDGRPINFLFIDGDHTLPGVTRDWQLYNAEVEPGGLIAFHDIEESEKAPKVKVPVLWKELREKYEHKEFIHDRGGVMGIGVLWK